MRIWRGLSFVAAILIAGSAQAYFWLGAAANDAYVAPSGPTGPITASVGDSTNGFAEMTADYTGVTASGLMTRANGKAQASVYMDDVITVTGRTGRGFIRATSSISFTMDIDVNRPSRAWFDYRLDADAGDAYGSTETIHWNNGPSNAPVGGRYVKSFAPQTPLIPIEFGEQITFTTWYFGITLYPVDGADASHSINSFSLTANPFQFEVFDETGKKIYAGIEGKYGTIYAVPEPASIATLLIGGLALLRRTKRR